MPEMHSQSRSGKGSVADQADARVVRWAFLAILVAMLPAVLDQTVLATALPRIATDLGRLADASWVVTAYVVAAAAAAPLWGKLGDRRGRKPLLESSLVMFLAASAVSGLSQSLAMLIVARAAQGAAAGGLMTLAMAAVADFVSPRERGRYQGYIMATFAVAASLGPLLGGLLVDHASWRWVFYINLPLGALALAGLRRRLPAPPVAPRRAPVDALGGALLAAATTALMLVCIWGGQRYAWGSPEIVGLIAGFALCAVGLVVRTGHAEDPIVPLSLVRNRAVALSSAALFLVTASMFAVTVFVPLFLQTTTGASPTQAGLLLIPMMAGIAVSTNFAGRMIERTGRYKVYPLAGLVLVTSAVLALAGLVQHPSQATTGLALALFGVGFGMVGQVLIVAVQNSVDRRDVGVAMAVTGFFRALGGAVGAAVLGVVFAARVGTTGTGTVALHPAGRADVIAGVHDVFLVTAPIVLIALLAVAALREIPLQTGPKREPDQPIGQRQPDQPSDQRVPGQPVLPEAAR